MQLSWIDNNQFAGEYMADHEKYFADAGIPKTTLVPGGSSATTAEAAITSGTALLGVGDLFTTANADAAGGDLKIIAATYQRNPFALISMTKDPIATPADLVGKTIAIPDVDDSLWKTFLAANNVDASKVKVVPYQFDSSILTSGQVDGILTYTTVGANLLKSEGHDAQEFLLADNGLPLVGDAIVTSAKALKEDRPTLTAALYAIIRGWYWSAAHPEDANHLTNSIYAAAQKYDDAPQLIAMKANVELLESPDTASNGLLTISDSLQQANVKVLNDSGIKVTAKDIFDTSLITEIYAAHPELPKK
ncbi:hypothetical protein BH11ACT2_BH11ACT2_03720 [soil metagenome]